MGQLHTIKQIPLGWFTLFLAYFYLLAGCGMQKAANEAFDLLAVPPHFPPCFSIHTPVSFRTPDQTFRLHVVWSVQYDQQIHFIVKGPLGIEVIRGLIDKKGVTLLDKLYRTVHQWDYKRIKADYAIDGNYLFVQSLLLGRVYNPIKPKKGPLIPDGAGPSVTYTYDECTDEVRSVHLIDKKQGNRLSLFYQYKMVTDRLLLSGIKIGFALRDKRDKKKLYKGRIILHKFRCKKLKKPNIRLKIPAHYLRK